jgi:hypothetical protein
MEKYSIHMRLEIFLLLLVPVVLVARVDREALELPARRVDREALEQQVVPEALRLAEV